MPGTIPGSPVLEFYNDAKIFMTGGTGFLGKVILEKFLRVCTNVNHIYVLVRIKKGKDPQTRIKELFEDPLYDTLRKERPDFEKKVTCIPGDVTGPKLNMSDDDYDFLTNEVTHVIHSAATVRFNERLKSAISINVFGTTEIIEFCKKCIRLKILVHVSTAYANCHRNVVDEEYYEPPMSASAAIGISKILDADKLDSITEQLIKPWPNTYSFTKAIGENAIKESGNTFPTLIFRPSIVMGTLQEPVEGWIDNIYGPTGVIVATGAGLLRVLYADSSKQANLIPVDLTVNALLCCAWEVGTNFNNNTIFENSMDNSNYSKKVDTVPKIYNFVSRKNQSVTWGEFLKLNLNHGVKVPSSKSIWYYTLTLTNIKIFYYILTVFFHYIPAILMDGVLLLIGKKPQLWNAYKKIHTFGSAMAVFAVNTWEFSDDNVRQLWHRLSDADKKLFNFDMSDFDWDDYFRITILGVRRFIFRESEHTLPAAKRRMLFLWMGHRLLQFSFLGLSFWAASKIFFSLGGFPKAALENAIITKPELIRNST